MVRVRAHWRSLVCCARPLRPRELLPPLEVTAAARSAASAEPVPPSGHMLLGVGDRGVHGHRRAGGLGVRAHLSRAPGRGVRLGAPEHQGADRADRAPAHGRGARAAVTVPVAPSG